MLTEFTEVSGGRIICEITITVDTPFGHNYDAHNLTSFMIVLIRDGLHRLL